MKPIDASFVPPGLPESAENGLVAQFHPNGSLRHFARYRDGSCAAEWALYLEADEERGRAVCEQGSGGTADYETYRDGCSEKFDAWSDNSRPSRVPWELWVTRWIARIAK